VSRPLDVVGELKRIRKELSRRRRAPLRVIIASDPERPVRTLVIPRLLPRILVGAGTVLLLFALGSSLTSLHLGGLVGDLQVRMGSMVQAAEEVARHPAPQEVPAPIPLAKPAARRPVAQKARVELELVNTGERLQVEFDAATGEPDAANYRRLRHFMRCQRTGAETPLDPRLVELLHRLAQRTRQRIQVVSGFRAPMFSTADLSYHTRGMAADIRIPGMTPLMVRDLAESMGVGGLGYYPSSQFVHVDVRDERARWIDYSHDKGDGEGREHGRDARAAKADLSLAADRPGGGQGGGGEVGATGVAGAQRLEGGEVEVASQGAGGGDPLAGGPAGIGMAVQRTVQLDGRQQ
jgi:uncharacterized protein YcbK (DUF882 family)